MEQKLNILLVSNGFYPEISARSFRATELAAELARQGHDVKVITRHRDYDYTSFLAEVPIKFSMWSRTRFPGAHTLIGEQREFVVNLPPASLLPQVMKVGSMSGRDHDKFAEIGLTPLPATHVRPPLIAECPVNIECKLLFVQTIGDHDLFAGEVLAHHVDPDVLGENGAFDAARLSTLVLAGGHFFDLGERLRSWK